MERKVIQLAGKTLVVSLPSKWARKYGVKKGDAVFVEEKDKSIVISTKKGIDVKKASIALKGPFEAIKRNIDVAYKKGVDELNLGFDSPKTRKLVSEILDSTMGFEIISQGDKSCVVRSVAAAIEGEFDNLLRKIFLTIMSMAEESYDAVLHSSFSSMGDISHYDQTVNKLTNFCKRILNKKGYKDSRLTNYIYCIVWELERVGDEYRRVCEVLAPSRSPKISRETLQLYKEANDFFRDFYTFFYKFSQEKGIELTNSRNRISAKANVLMQKKKGAECVVVHHLANIIKATYDLAGPYYAMAL